MMKISRLSMAMAFLGLSTSVFASDFSLPFINVAGLGTAYSDWATSASDASTTYSNPAGLTKLTHQQLVVAALGIKGNTRFEGSSLTPAFPFFPQVGLSGSSGSKISAFLPSFYYARPINNKITVGFGVTAPFALGSNYDKDSIVRYVSTRSSVVVVDLGPSVGVKLSDKVSVGLGIDAARIAFTLNNMFGPPLSFPGDSEGQNHLSGWGYGWHGGILYEPLATTRIGVSFNSMIGIHTTGDSELYKPNGLVFRTTNQKTNAALPARTQVSAQHDITKQLTVMGTVYYTNWRTFDKINMKRVMAPIPPFIPGPGAATTFVSIPFNYHNTFDYSLGLTYKATPKWMLRTGLQVMSTPSNNQNRGVADPIGSATVLAIGAHYEQNKQLSYDIGYGHSFFKQQSVDLVIQPGDLTRLSGHTNTQTNVFGAQLNWNIV